MIRLKRLISILLLAFWGLTPSAGYGQGKVAYPRFQYHSYHWRTFHTSAFHIYFPVGYDSLCAHIAGRMPGATALIRKRMATSLQQTPNILVYPSADQLYESNAGSSETKDVTLPTFIAKGSRLLLAYTGSYEDVDRQLNEALVRAIWEAQLNEGLEAQAAGTVHTDQVPYWMKEGMIRYFAHGWPLEAEDQLLQSITTMQPCHWEAIAGTQQALAGQALCYYLSRAYYPEVPMQLYFLLRKRKPLPRALRLITKTEADSVLAGCLDFYRSRILQPDAPKDSTGQLTIIPRKKGKVFSVLADPAQEVVAYTISTWHRRTVYLYDLRTRQTTRVIHYDLPPWINDHSSDLYPLLAWNGKELLVTLPVKKDITIRRYDRNGHLRDRFPQEGVDGVSTVLPDDKNFLLAAWRKGQSDIVRYNSQRNKYTPLTYDRYDDGEPVINEKYKVIYFVSNRPLTSKKEDTICRQGIFRLKENQVSFMTVDQEGDNIRWQLPQVLPDGRIIATTTQNGRRQFAELFDQPILGPLFQPAQFSANGKDVLISRSTRDSLFISRQDLDTWLGDSTANQPSPWLNDYGTMAAARAKEDSLLRAAAGNNQPSFLDGMLSRGRTKEQQSARQDSVAQALKYEPGKVHPYLLQLYSAYFIAKVNNDYFFNRYQPYLAYQGMFKAPATGGMAQGGFSDLFENHHFTIAYRIPAGSEGSDFFVRYRNTAKKTDWGLAYYRKAEDLKPDPYRNWKDEDGRTYPNTAKVKTNYYEVFLQHPLSYFSAVEATLGFRQDKTVFLATERYSLDFPPVKSLWSMLTVAYKINRLQSTLPLLSKGFRGGVAVDVFKGFTQRQDALVGLSLHGAWHKPIYKYITLVVQAKAGYSAGDRRILYNLGGVENNVTPRIDSTVHFAQEAPFAFQTLITPFRGHYQNSLYGSQYALLNADVYFPLFQTLIPLETPLSAINNLQLGVFSDIAAAGGNKNYTTAAKGWQAAYGLSARTTLAGYPLRFDIAWPGDFSKQPVWYLSLNVE